MFKRQNRAYNRFRNYQLTDTSGNSLSFLKVKLQQKIIFDQMICTWPSSAMFIWWWKKAEKVTDMLFWAKSDRLFIPPNFTLILLKTRHNCARRATFGWGVQTSLKVVDNTDLTVFPVLKIKHEEVVSIPKLTLEQFFCIEKCNYWLVSVNDLCSLNKNSNNLTI